MTTEPDDAVSSQRPKETRDATIHVSVMLAHLLDRRMPDQVSLGWLMERLHERSFGAGMLILAIAGILPLISVPVGVLLMPLALQLMFGRGSLGLPGIVADRPLPSRRIEALLRKAIAVIRYLETFVVPRWHVMFRARRLVGLLVLLLALSLFIPIPFSNVVPALAIALIALAYLERDGLLLSLSMVAGVIALGVGGLLVWGLVATL